MLLEIGNLSVEIGRPGNALHVVRDVSLSLRRGEVLGIVGESGSGKSMTALSLMRLLPPSARIAAGTITLDGEDLVRLPDAAFAGTIPGRRVAMIFQEPMTCLNPVYTIGRQLTEAATQFGGLSSKAAHDRALELLTRVGIPDPAGRMSSYPHQLSGGQRQRVMIAMALMLEPELLIADEPTTALDVTVQAQILELLASLRAETGMAMILISHDLAVMSAQADRMAVMYGGEIVEQGRAGAVLAAPRHPYTRALLAAIPRMEDRPRPLVAIPGTVPTVRRVPGACIFAPRCEYVHDACTAAPPGMRGDAGHGWRCVLDTLPGAAPPAAARAVGAATGTGEAVIAAKDVTRLFRSRRALFGPVREVKAVDGVSLALLRGETLALVGESGSGKSTLARILLGLDRPTSGSVAMLGRPVAELSPQERAGFVQPVFQDPYASLNPRRTLAEIVGRPLALRGEGTRSERMARVREAMEMVRLPMHLLNAYPAQLSGGQRQRVAIARALITRPAALVCDEPTSALDVSVQAQILNLLSRLRAELGLTTLIITHNMAVVNQIADRVAVMFHGRLIEVGPVAQVLKSPAQDYTRTLLEAAPRFLEAAE
ncbi:MAG TPA: ABC transporter ATP-binding protein [Hyphomicrobiaceae bacterium]|nr:ABC transporter ATP-binding protein [Hyphomicrobiaceae bacterium]